MSKLYGFMIYNKKLSDESVMLSDCGAKISDRKVIPRPSRRV